MLAISLKELSAYVHRCIPLFWIPLQVVIHRSAAWFVPIYLIFSKPTLNRDKYIILFLLWCALSICWTPDPWRASRVLICLCMFLLLEPTHYSLPSEKLMGWAAWASLLIAVVFVYMHNSYKTVALVYSPIALTVSLACAAYPSWSFILCSALISVLVDCDTAILTTIGVGVGRFIPLIWLKRFWLVLCLLGLLFTQLRFLTIDHIQAFERVLPSFSYVHRLNIYKAVSNHVHQEPFVKQLKGNGLDSSRHINSPRLSFLRFNDTCQEYQTHESNMVPLHPHNIGLQVLLELGWVGLVLFGVLCLRFNPSSHKEALVAFVAAGQALVSIGVWQTWWLASVWMAFFLAKKTRKADI